MAAQEVLVGEGPAGRLVAPMRCREIVHIGQARIHELDRPGLREQPRDHPVVDIGEVLAPVSGQARRGGEERMDEDGVDFHAAFDRPEQLARMTAEVAVLGGDHLALEIVVGMLEGQRREFVGRDADRPVRAEALVDRRQEGLGLGHQVAAAAALVALVPVVRHVDERAARHDTVHRDHEQMRARPLGEVDRAVIEHAVEHVEILDQMAVAQDLDQAVGNDREFDVDDFRQLGEQRIGAQPLLAGRIGDDAEDDLALPGERRQVVLRQHRADVVAQEVADVFLAPDDASHGEDLDARMLRAIGGTPRMAGRELRGAMVEEGLDLGTEGQVAGRPGKIAKLVEQAEVQQVDPEPVQRLVIEGRASVGRLRSRDLLA